MVMPLVWSVLIGSENTSGEGEEGNKTKAGVLARHSLKEKVEDVIRKGPDPQAGKWNNHDIKVMI
jgi:hypothetical protein